MTKINKNFESLEQYTCREFDIKETVQLLILTNPSIWMSWGVEPNMLNYKNGKGLIFKVNGHLHKSFVFITLNGMDLFDAFLLSDEFVIIKEMRDIYNDSLQATIDVAVEKLDEYNF